MHRVANDGGSDDYLKMNADGIAVVSDDIYTQLGCFVSDIVPVKQ
ncbi:hypothetical protein [Natrinema zhouii]|nr:hypothetical protein [Natrinema zhouii]